MVQKTQHKANARQRVRAAIQQHTHGQGLTLLLGKNNFDHTPVKLSTVPVFFGILRIFVVEEFDEGKRLPPPGKAQTTTSQRTLHATVTANVPHASSVQSTRGTYIAPRTERTGANTRAKSVNRKPVSHK